MRRAPTGPASNRSDIAQACGPPASWGRVRAPAARAATTQALSPPPRIASETSSRQIFKMAARTAASSASLGLPFVTRIELASTAGSYRHARQSIRHRRLHTPNGPSEPTPGGAKMSAPNRKGGRVRSKLVILLLVVPLLGGTKGASAMDAPSIQVVGVTPSGAVITCSVSAAVAGPPPLLSFIATTTCDRTMVFLSAESTPHNHTTGRTYAGLYNDCEACTRIPADSYVSCGSCGGTWSTHGKHVLQFVDGTAITVSGGTCAVQLFTATCTTHTTKSY